MGLYIKAVDNSLTPEELKIKRDKELKDLFTSVPASYLDKLGWKARKENKSNTIYIADTRNELWNSVGILNVNKIKRAIEATNVTTASVANKNTMDTVPFRQLYTGSKNHIIYTNIVEKTAEDVEQALINGEDGITHPTLVCINLYTLKDHPSYVMKSLEANYLFKDKISDTLLTDDAWKILMKTTDAFAKHGLEVNSSPAVAICAVEGKLPTSDDEAKATNDWTAKSMYYMAKNNGTVVYNMLDEADRDSLIGILTLVKEGKLELPKITDYLSQQSTPSAQNVPSIDVDNDDIPF